MRPDWIRANNATPGMYAARRGTDGTHHLLSYGRFKWIELDNENQIDWVQEDDWVYGPIPMRRKGKA